MAEPPPKSARAQLWPYALPYLVYVALGSVFDAREQPLALQGSRALAVGAALAWGMRDWRPLRGPKGTAGSVGLGALAGLAGTAVWIALVSPFVDPDAAPFDDTAWSARALVATALPPLIEEPLLRGYLFGLVLLFERARRAGSRAPLADALDRGSLAEVAPGEWSALAVAVSTAAFALGHAPHEWLAACTYGLLMCGLWIARSDLVSCVSAHAVTNAALAVYVRASGHWALW
jgi:membrane protease YdiL (CAAX protease family)